MARTRGFTLIELLIVVALAVLLAALAFPALQSFRANADLNATQDTVLAALRSAHSRTLASEGLAVHGVHFDADRVVIFQGTTYVSQAPGNEMHSVPSSVALQNVDVTSWPDITFARLSGEALGTGTARAQHSTGRTRDIAIRSFVEAARPEGLPGELGTRVTDTRHVHFDLGWSLLDMENLVLSFSTNTGSQIETIALADYFAGSPVNEFNWEGTFTIDGKLQTIHIHTHLLTAGDTVLSVHRNRHEASKALTISFFSSTLGTRNVASYTSSGELTVEADGGTATVQ